MINKKFPVSVDVSDEVSDHLAAISAKIDDLLIQTAIKMLEPDERGRIVITKEILDYIWQSFVECADVLVRRSHE